MPENVLKATVDAIAESDNEIGGQLITRLRQKAKWGRNDGFLATANPTRISVPTGVGWFESWMVGIEIDIIVEATFKGRYTVFTVDSSGDFCTVQILGGGAPGFTDTDPVQIRMATLLVETTFEFLDPSTHVTDDIGSLWVGLEDGRVTYGAVQVTVGDMEFQQLGDPDTGAGYLTMDHPPLTEITEGSQSYSALDKLRRAMLADYATEDELDRIGRNVAVQRPSGSSDDIYRAVLKVLAYMPKGLEFGLEMLLDALYPGGGWSIYEDLINHNNTVFISLPVMDPGSDEEGRAFISSEESQTATSVTTVDVDHTPISVTAIRLADVTLALDMAVLPSAATPAWTYVNEGDTEGNTFSIVSGELQHVQGPGDALGGRYERTEAELGIALPPVYGVNEVLWSVSIDWKGSTVTTEGGLPWIIMVTDGVKEYAIAWDTSDIELGQTDGSTVASGGTRAPGSGSWRRMQIRRKGDYIEALMDGTVELSAAVSAFAADATTKISFGYWNNAANQDWTVLWDNAAVRIRSKWRDFWNLFRQTGTLSTADADLDDGGNPFVAGDDGKYVRTYSDNNENDGLWLASYVGAGTLTLDGVPLDRARVLTPDPGTPSESLVILEEPYFRPEDIGKEINISGSGLGNDGDYAVTDWINSLSVVVDASALSSGFVAESLLTWKFNPEFANESNVDYEVVDAGSVASKTLTVHASESGWPNAAQDLVVDYTSVLSMQLMRNETVENEGSGGSAGNVYYPLYLWDIEQSIRDLFDAVTAAGVIPEFEREW
jgi:hypothetical protein